MSQIKTLRFTSSSQYNFTARAGKNDFRFHIRYVVSDNSYYMDIDIEQDGSFVPIARCIRICCGVDLFITLRRYGLGSLFVIPLDSRYNKETGPNPDNIMTAYKMVWEHD